MIIMGLDYGESRIGVAVCDALEIAAHARPTVRCTGDELDRIAAMAREEGVGRVVVGLPLRLDGSEGRAAHKVRRFAKQLRRELSEIELVFMDERLTTAQAHEALSLQGVSNRRRRNEVDGMAAQIILHRYLEARRARRGGGPVQEGQSGQ